MNRRHLVALIAWPALGVACAETAPPPQPATPPRATANAFATAGSAAPTAAPPSSVAPSAAPPASASAASTTAHADPTALLTELAAHTQGMTAATEIITGRLAAGGVVERKLTLRARKCYTVVAAGAGIAELDVMLLGQLPPLPEGVLVQDDSTGGLAVLGGAGECYPNPAAADLPVRLQVRATTGQGPIAAQVFVK